MVTISQVITHRREIVASTDGHGDQLVFLFSCLHKERLEGDYSYSICIFTNCLLSFYFYDYFNGY